MCGLWGWQRNELSDNNSAFAIAAGVLMTTMETRGDHSWGIYTPKGLEKGLGPVTETLRATSFAKTKIVMAHCRLASQGAITIENSHPFQIGHVIGCHNGTLTNHSELNKEFGRNFEVDSMHIIAHLDEQREMKNIYGYGAITWIDDREKDRINLLKWNTGTIAIAELIGPDKKPAGVVWASTLAALAPALDVAGFDWLAVEVKDGIRYFASNGEAFTNATEPITFGARNNITSPAHRQSPSAYNNWGMTQTAHGQSYHHWPMNTPLFPNDTARQDDAWPAGTSTMSRKCFSCDEQNIACVKHEITKSFLCYNCTQDMNNDHDITENLTDEPESPMDDYLEGIFSIAAPADKLAAAVRDYINTGAYKSTLTLAEFTQRNGEL